jgi:NhaP-type Na+/H+ or K+/H+ antiporter
VALVLLAPGGPYTATIAAATYAVVMVTIIVQGLLTPIVLGRLYGDANGAPIEGKAPS